MARLTRREIGALIDAGEEVLAGGCAGFGLSDDGEREMGAALRSGLDKLKDRLPDGWTWSWSEASS